VLRSRKDLEDNGVSFLAASAVPPGTLPITADGVTFNMAQEVTWVDDSTFAVGRWDGTFSLFRFNDSPTAGPLVTASASTPATEGVQMIVWLGAGTFATSNDGTSIVLWSTGDGTWRDLRESAQVSFDSSLGVANSGDVVDSDEGRHLVVGHANGFASVWLWSLSSSRLELRRTIDLRSEKPTNPWGIHNIRGVASVAPTVARANVITGSEDGSLCLVDILSGAIRSRTVYNPAAERGINGIALLGSKLLVANCAVGPSDSNIWSFDVDGGAAVIAPRDRARLVVDPAAPQVFNFCTVWGKYSGGACYFSSTEEGALWMGTVDASGKLSTIGYMRVTSPLGAALAYNGNGRLVLAAYDLHEFRTGASVGTDAPNDGQTADSQSRKP
jgi:hypothetical protein